MVDTKNKLLKYCGCAMIVFIIVICIISVYLISSAKKELYFEKVQYLDEVTSKSANLIQCQVNTQLKGLEATAIVISSHETFDVNHIIPILQEESIDSEFKRMGIIELDGTATTTDGYVYDFKDREYFKKAMAGESVVSDLLVDKIDGQQINVFATPIEIDKEVIGVLFATQSVDVFSHVLEVESFGTEGYSYVIKKDGTPVIFTTHKNSVGKFNNLFEVMETSSENKSYTEKLRTDMQEGRSGTFSCEKNNVSRQISYTKIGLNDWYLVSVVPTEVISKASDRLVDYVVLAATIILISTILLGYLLVHFLKKTNDQLQSMAFVDSITGCPNWNKFEIDSLALLRKHIHLNYAMIHFDIDKFKIINDLYGYQSGNEVLKHIADELRKTTDELETFCRGSSDNFYMLVHYETNEDIIKRIVAIKEQVLKYIDGHIIRLDFGIFKIETRFNSINVIMDRANLARLAVKTNPNLNYDFFDEEKRKRVLVESEIENCMEVALKNHEFEVYLQPQYNFKTNEIVGAEALVRWNQPGKGILPPNSFIPLFEKNGFVKKLDEYMFEQVCILLRKWNSINPEQEPIPISVNFSRLHLNNFMLSCSLLEITKKYLVNPKWIEIEITESAAFDNMQKLLIVMNELKAAGFNLAIDDFGSGYSSLNTLKDLPATVLKMDRGFLKQTKDDERSRFIIASIIQMARGLGLRTVAEGVETLEQVTFLKDVGCDVAQGYYYAKPMPVKEFEELIDLY